MRQIVTSLFILLLSIVIVVPRLTNLGTTPPGLHIDEVSFAADAKAIAQSGADTWGVKWPRVFKAYGEWKAPGLVYSMAFWTKLTGVMNSTIARLPSAIAGLTILVMFSLTLRSIFPAISWTALAFGLAILAYSPWHFDLSRIFYESFSALSWLSISLYFATRQILGSKYNAKLMILAIVTAAIAGYYYASIRYVVIGYCILLTLLTPWHKRELPRRLSFSLVVLLIVGLGWIADLFSTVGLNRLNYYTLKANYGSSLTIDEKRQYCFLSLDRSATKTKGCYLLWNKPVSRFTGGVETVMTYLGTNFLFLHGESEYGFDSQYGAFLPPVILLYLVGLYQVLAGCIRYLKSLFNPKSHSDSHDRLFVLYAVVALLALVPAALALNLNLRMATVTLYLISLTIGIGLITTLTWLCDNIPKILRLIIYLAFTLSLGFYIIQSQVHYYFVFTHSNDLQWTSDAAAIFGYVKSVSPNYSRIIDTELHGPLAPYFYGDLTTQEVQSGTHSSPDDLGFTYLIKAGKYELRHVGIKDIACETLSQKEPLDTLVITSPIKEYTSFRRFASYSWNQALLLHEVYDLRDVIAQSERSDPNFLTRCQPK